MDTIIDEIVLIENERKNAIGYVKVSLDIDYPKFKEKAGISNNYKRYLGEIKLDNLNTPDELLGLLDEQNLLASEYSFSLLDDIGERINKFPIYLMSTMTRIYGLVCENGNGGFEIISIK